MKYIISNSILGILLGILLNPIFYFIIGISAFLYSSHCYSLGINDNFHFYLDTSLQKYSVKIDGVKFENIYNINYNDYFKCNDKYARLILVPFIISGLEDSYYSCSPRSKLNLFQNQFYHIEGYFDVTSNNQIMKIKFIFPYDPWKNETYNNIILLFLEDGKLSYRLL